MSRIVRSDVSWNGAAALLADHPLLAGLDPSARERLLGESVLLRLDAGEHLFMHGDAAARFFVVRSGRLKLYRLADNGREQIIRLVGPGESFAEGVLFMAEPRYPVNAAALTASTVLGLSRPIYRAILEASVESCLSVMGTLTSRIQRLIDELDALTLRDSRYRVIAYLVELVPGAANAEPVITLPARRHEIAARLGIRPETLSRVLRELADDGLIRPGAGARLTVLRPEALRRRLDR